MIRFSSVFEKIEQYCDEDYKNKNVQHVCYLTIGPSLLARLF